MTVRRYGAVGAASALALGLLGAVAAPASAGAPADCAAAIATAAAATGAAPGFVELETDVIGTGPTDTVTTVWDATGPALRWTRHTASAVPYEDDVVYAPSGVFMSINATFARRLRSPLRAVLAVIGHPGATWAQLGPTSPTLDPVDLVTSRLQVGLAFTSETSNLDGTTTILCSSGATSQTWTVDTSGRMAALVTHLDPPDGAFRQDVTWTYAPQSVEAPASGRWATLKTIELGDDAAALRGDMSHLAARIAAGANARARKTRSVVTTRLIRTFAHGMAVRQRGLGWSSITVHVTNSVRGSTLTAVNPFTHQVVAYRIRVAYGKAKVSRLH